MKRHWGYTEEHLPNWWMSKSILYMQCSQQVSTLSLLVLLPSFLGVLLLPFWDIKKHSFGQFYCTFFLWQRVEADDGSFNRDFSLIVWGKPEWWSSFAFHFSCADLGNWIGFAFLLSKTNKMRAKCPLSNSLWKLGIVWQDMTYSFQAAHNSDQATARQGRTRKAFSNKFNLPLTMHNYI